MSPNTKKPPSEFAQLVSYGCRLYPIWSRALTFVVNVLQSVEGRDALPSDLLTSSDLRCRVLTRSRLLVHLKSALHEQVGTL